MDRGELCRFISENDVSEDLMDDPDEFLTLIYIMLTSNCQSCHDC